ncbi:MAG: potassium-transporting ATPase subunit KdpA [Candidatus Melainabacteria bacterium]|nr:MAG: potassium-transporting ATPase subunit KdpA [Candidatus Melainabacteria bacterium]
MTGIGWLQILLFVVALIVITKPAGTYIKRVMECEATWLDPLFRPVEKIIYRIAGVDETIDMHWTQYAFCMLAFSIVTLLFSYAILRLQGVLPFNPMSFSTAQAPAFATAMTPDLAFNTAVSFTTNTNWQAYSGENTMSYLSQMLALALHNWVSAAAGIAVAVAMIRGFSRQSATGIGNFWKDLVRSTLYVLLPVCLIAALFMVSQGVVQNFSPYVQATTLEGAQQIIPQGPIASQECIKMFGTNGGGFLNANSAHPFENPTPLCNFVEMLLIFMIPAGLAYTFGLMVKDTRQGWALFITMMMLFVVGVITCYGFEASGNPNIARLNVNTSTSQLGDLGGNQEGKEVRFGLANSALFAVITTDASCGAVNSMHDSFTPLGGLVPLLNIQLGELIFGGVGAGLYGILIFAILTVFIAGLMVGRTPEYVGKKIEKKEVKMAMLFVLVAAFSILGFTACGAILELPAGSFWNAAGATYNNVNNNGAHGFSEIMYAFTSATGNNGSAFAGISVNTPFYNLTLAMAMLMGRFMMQIPVLAIAGSLSAKKYIPTTSGTFPTDGFVFIVLLISVIIIVGALTFFPGLTLGPIVEHFLMHSGKLY